jgi:hypothetical protein
VGHDLRRGECVPFKTVNSARCCQTDDFEEDFVYITQDAMDFLGERAVQAAAWITSPSAASGNLASRHTQRYLAAASG